MFAALSQTKVTTLFSTSQVLKMVFKLVTIFVEVCDSVTSKTSECKDNKMTSYI
jgi:hypothetical protein